MTPKKTIRVVIPQHLRTLASISEREMKVEACSPVTHRTVLDAVEARYPVLVGSIRDHVTLERRKLVRFFACEQDLSHESPNTPLPAKVANGEEPYFVIAAIAGG